MGVNGGGNFWGFLASISPFESWRKYLVFRHKRDQDHRYREAAEARRLDLENDARELALLEKRATIARQLGATQEQLEPLCNRILGVPSYSLTAPIASALPPKESLLLTSGDQLTASEPAPPEQVPTDAV
jgi:hypothetical protein